jgi:hypothetical protein
MPMKIQLIIKTAVLAAVAQFFAIQAQCQTTPAHGFVLAGALDVGVPTGSARTTTNFTLGGDLRLQYGLTNNFAFTVTTGGYHFFPTRIPGTDSRHLGYGVGPIKGGIKIFFLPHLYFGAEAGEAVEVTKQGIAKGQTRLLLAPSLGIANKHWDVSVRYENYSGVPNFNNGQVALRVGYGIRL